jgi:hypothetical protein
MGGIRSKFILSSAAMTRQEFFYMPPGRRLASRFLNGMAKNEPYLGYGHLKSPFSKGEFGGILKAYLIPPTPL